MKDKHTHTVTYKGTLASFAKVLKERVVASPSDDLLRICLAVPMFLEGKNAESALQAALVASETYVDPQKFENVTHEEARLEMISALNRVKAIYESEYDTKYEDNAEAKLAAREQFRMLVAMVEQDSGD